MGENTLERQEAIRHSQNQLLYGGIKFSAAGSLAASIVVLYTFGPLVDAMAARGWFVFITQLLLIMTLGGVAGGALASLPYDRLLNLGFQLIILISVELRLFMIGGSFALEVALFSLFVFGFLLSCGKEVGNNYLELIRLKQDIQDKSTSVMKTTERMAHIGYWEWDGEAANIELSDNLADIWNVDTGQMEITKCFQRIHNADRNKVRKSFTKVRGLEEDVVVEFRMLLDVTGVEYRSMRQVIKETVDRDGTRHMLGTVQDITDIKSAEEKIYTMAYYDGLTGLANRSYFHEYLNSVVANAEINKSQFSIVYIDLDNFKGVNDSYGHECGDGYLQNFAEHLKENVRKTDLVARLGGDEFCILVNDIEDVSESVFTAERCLEFSAKTLEIGNHRIKPQLSVGIATYPKDGLEPDDIVKSADLAMYYVKNNGKQDYAIYHERMAIETEDQMRLEADLKLALDNDEFELWYQPQVNIQENTYSGVAGVTQHEAWFARTYSLLLPSESA